MASLQSCCTTLRLPPFASRISTSSSLPPSASVVGSRFLGGRKTLGWFRPSVVGPCNGSRTRCWFKFGKNGVDAEGAGIYGSQSRDDFDRDDVEQDLNSPEECTDWFALGLLIAARVSNQEAASKTTYFNYMGMLAVEGSYDKMETLLNQNIHPVDILLMMATSEGDKPKIEELLRAGAKFDIKDSDGRTALDRADEETKEFILGFMVQKS